METWNWPRIRAAGVIFEDDEVLVLNKPAGISVTGERHETDIVTLAREAGEELHPAHRIDKVTSGAVLFAKRMAVHGGLTRQFNKRTVDKAYLVIARDVGLPPDGEIDLPLSVGRKATVRIAALRENIRREGSRWFVAREDLLDTRMYPSVTRFSTILGADDFSVLVARPVTGRRHQIRVHLAWIGHPIVGDPLFDKAAAKAGARTCLHSFRLGFDASWRSDPRIDVEAPPDAGFWAPLLAGRPDTDVEELLAAARR